MDIPMTRLAHMSDRMFEAIDSNNADYICWEDMARLADTYQHVFEVPETDRRAQALKACYRMYWMELLRHAGGIDRLDKDHFRLGNYAASVDTSRFNLTDGLTSAIFDVIDLDATGKITRDDFEQHFRIWCNGAPDSSLYDRLDVDADGYLTRQAFIRAMRELYFAANFENLLTTAF
ncbi:EF-hand domain-containing protein [Streptomyces sp. NPDC090112]|uniref:EF-hand domain-containing protein n=1 Tax=Streptomyces sp. NPDC090112 TaxID=3365949 RepID=UPI00382186D0